MGNSAVSLQKYNYWLTFLMHTSCVTEIGRHPSPLSMKVSWNIIVCIIKCQHLHCKSATQIQEIFVTFKVYALHLTL